MEGKPMNQSRARAWLIFSTVGILLAAGIFFSAATKDAAVSAERIHLIEVYKSARAARLAGCCAPDSKVTWIGELPIEEANQLLGANASFGKIDPAHPGEEVLVLHGQHSAVLVKGKAPAVGGPPVGDVSFHTCLDGKETVMSMQPGQSGIVARVIDQEDNSTGQSGKDGLTDELMIEGGDVTCIKR